MKMVIAFCEGGYGNRYFQLSYLLRNFRTSTFFIIQTLEINGAKAFRFRKKQNIYFFTLHPRLYCLLKRIITRLAIIFDCKMIIEENDEALGPTGNIKSTGKKDYLIIALDFYIISTVNFDKLILLNDIYLNKSHLKNERKLDLFIHIRMADYKSFNYKGKYLDYSYYYRYYLRSLRKISSEHPEIKTLGVYSDELNHPLVRRVIKYALKKKFKTYCSRNENPITDWAEMTYTKFGGICSASTFSLSALLSSNYSIGYIPKYWLNFNRFSTFPKSMDNENYSSDGNIWII